MASNNLIQAARRTSAMGPSVKNLLAQYNLDPKQIVSTGPHQILLKGDVLSYISEKKLEPIMQSQQQSISVGASHQQTSNKKFTPNLDISGYQPKPGPEGFSKIAKKLLDM